MTVAPLKYIDRTILLTAYLIDQLGQKKTGQESIPAYILHQVKSTSHEFDKVRELCDKIVRFYAFIQPLFNIYADDWKRQNVNECIVCNSLTLDIEVSAVEGDAFNQATTMMICMLSSVILKDYLKEYIDEFEDWSDVIEVFNVLFSKRTETDIVDTEEIQRPISLYGDGRNQIKCSCLIF